MAVQLASLQASTVNTATLPIAAPVAALSKPISIDEWI